MVSKIILNNREEWLAHRNKIGGSDAAAILGKSPYMTNEELWKIKKGLMKQKDISEEPFVKYGTDAEKYLRELFKLDYPQYKVDYEENNMWFNDKYPWAHASLDGYLTDETGRRGVWECKTTNILQSSQKENWNDKIPDNYYIQVLHYLMVTEFDFVVLKAQLKWEHGKDIYCQTKHYFIERSEVENDIEMLINEEQKFWNSLKEDKKPGLLLNL